VETSVQPSAFKQQVSLKLFNNYFSRKLMQIQNTIIGINYGVAPGMANISIGLYKGFSAICPEISGHNNVAYAVFDFDVLVQKRTLVIKGLTSKRRFPKPANLVHLGNCIAGLIGIAASFIDLII